MSQLTVFSDKSVEDLAYAELSPVDPLNLAKEKGVSREDALVRLRKIAILFSKRRVYETVERDILVIQAINALDELNDSINLLSNRLGEWYGLHSPELVRDTKSATAIAAAVREKKGKSIMGLDLLPEDFTAIEAQAKTIEGLIAYKHQIEKYIETLMTELAPNLASLAGVNLAARLIAKGGSLKKLARIPASTMQVYGAEKALFKHIVRGTPCPKHGIIFQHPSITGAKRSNRGKIARALASKLVLAARIDYYSKDLHPELKADFEKRLLTIKGDKK